MYRSVTPHIGNRCSAQKCVARRGNEGKQGKGEWAVLLARHAHGYDFAKNNGFSRKAVHRTQTSLVGVSVRVGD
jgi:hypothetical protein